MGEASGSQARMKPPSENPFQSGQESEAESQPEDDDGETAFADFFCSYFLLVFFPLSLSIIGAVLGIYNQDTVTWYTTMTAYAY